MRIFIGLPLLLLVHRSAPLVDTPETLYLFAEEAVSNILPLFQDGVLLWEQLQPIITSAEAMGRVLWVPSIEGDDGPHWDFEKIRAFLQSHTTQDLSLFTNFSELLSNVWPTAEFPCW